MIGTWLYLLILLLPWPTACTSEPAVPVLPKREFRAVWVTTKHNIDWPSSRGLSVAEQQAEFRAMLDYQQANGMNAVVVQIRPSGDAFYPSRLVPWSEWLAGEQGRAPLPYYDPLAFMIAEVHARNMEFHAWMNPFRAVSHTRFSSVGPTHVSRTHPEWVFAHGNSLYLDPGQPAVRSHLTQVVMEVVRNYDIDGLHFDDYFYPYQLADSPIPDQQTFARHKGPFSNVADWRRSNIDLFIRGISDSLRAVRPQVKFGISPVGVWRNKDRDAQGSATRMSQTSYDHLYADVRKWLREGWIDYVAPQLYWGTEHPAASYSALLPWWSANRYDRHLYVGQAMFKLKEANQRYWDNPGQMRRQLFLNLEYSEVQGSIFFSAASFRDNPHQVESLLRDDRYRLPALVPPMPWKDSIPPLAPRHVQIERDPEGPYLSWAAPLPAADSETASYYVIYRFTAGERHDLSNPAAILARTRDRTFLDCSAVPGREYIYFLTAFDRLHNESLTGAAAYLPPTEAGARTP
ncbi:MAG: glycoside hydrolase family 10 protein [Bacteroidia bacterium]